MNVDSVWDIRIRTSWSSGDNWFSKVSTTPATGKLDYIQHNLPVGHLSEWFL